MDLHKPPYDRSKLFHASQRFGDQQNVSVDIDAAKCFLLNLEAIGQLH
jgi:hypothetical protein